MTEGRTYTVTHPAGVAYTTGNENVAFAALGWGWQSSTDPDRPPGVDLTAVKTKADLQGYADAVLIPGVDQNTQTRAEMEQTITAWHEENA